MRKGNTLTDHHRIPSSYGGTRESGNILRIKDRTHSAFHQVFDNDTPVMQIATLDRWNSAVLSDRFRSRILEILHDYSGEKEIYAYREGVLVPRRFLQAQEKYTK